MNDCTIIVEDRESYALLYVTGFITNSSEQLNFAMRLMDAIKDRIDRKLFVADCRDLVTFVRDIDVLNEVLVYSTRGAALPNRRVAFLCKNKDSHLNKIRGEMFTKRRLPFMLFTDLKSAEKWLMS